eukprot:15462639-Alexandrium_andersonii.AAC.1
MVLGRGAIVFTPWVAPHQEGRRGAPHYGDRGLSRSTPGRLGRARSAHAAAIRARAILSGTSCSSKERG